MRVIKFRIWDKEEKMFNAVDATKRKAVALFMNEAQVELMQYTGLKDKNGVEIYEGDIVKYKHPKYDEDFKISSVEYSDSLCAFTINDRYFSSLDTALLSLEVIGNIYEDKGLLDEDN